MLLTALGLDVTRLYADAAYVSLRVLVHNALAVFFVAFPLVLVVLKSRRGAALRQRLLAQCASDIEAKARAYLHVVEGEEGLLWRFEERLREALADIHLPAHEQHPGQEATEKLIRASRWGELQAVDLTAYREAIQLLQWRVVSITPVSGRR